MSTLWIKRALISIILFSLGVTAAQADPSTSANSSHLQLDTAFTAFQKGDYAKAINIWQDLSKSNHRQSAPDIDRALLWMYRAELGFDEDTDTDGLQKPIAPMVRPAPGDSRVDTLRAKFDALQNNKGAETNPSATKTSFGTAWPLENGYVVTNYHVIADSLELTLQNVNGHRIKAWPVLYDQASDLAVLAVEDARLLPPALPLCSTELPLGSSVFTLGFPRIDILGYTPKFTNGIIESNCGPLGNADQYLTTVDIQPGNSGGPLFNSNGEVVGVVTAMLGVRDKTTGALKVLPNHSCAVKTANVHQLIQRLPENGHYPHPIVGQNQSLQALRERLKASMLVVIAKDKT